VKATDIDLKRQVALKILSDKHRDDSELEARFIREGRAVAAISHSNVVQVFTTGIYDGRPYIAMEFLTGRDLGGFVQERGPLSSLHAARAVLDTARGLEAAADAGLIHRDVKPANLVMLDSGAVKVTDFGLAKPLDPSTEPALTALGVVVGTPDYIAPEQARGENIDERVDIYALGGTLYYLLTGKPPFRRGNPADDKYLKVVARHLQEPAPNPLLVSPDIDSQLAQLQLRMMSKKPRARPGYPELVLELTEIVDRLGGRRAPSAPDLMTAKGGSAPPAPTPYIGGRHGTAPIEEDPRDSAPTTARAAVQSPPPDRHQPSAGLSLPPPPRKRSGALVAMTVFSSLVFLVGLGLFLFGPLPEAVSKPALVSIDAAPVAVSPSDAALPEPPLTAPEGMVIVAATDQHPAFFISSAPVSYQEFSEIFPNQKKPSKKKKVRKQAVNKVTFAYAEAYARTKGGRLATPEEWASALATSEISFQAKRWEWLDDGTEGTQASRAIGNAKGEVDKRRPREHKDVGFRLVVDP
jgi:serine/threonine-protein kinase